MWSGRRWEAAAECRADGRGFDSTRSSCGPDKSLAGHCVQVVYAEPGHSGVERRSGAGLAACLNGCWRACGAAGSRTEGGKERMGTNPRRKDQHGSSRAPKELLRAYNLSESLEGRACAAICAVAFTVSAERTRRTVKLWLVLDLL